jgi:hypothetical protein
MATRTLRITDGPDKPTLQRVLTMPEKITAHFEVEGDVLEASISRMDEQPDGFSFELEGRVVSRMMKGAEFCAMYHIEGRSGSMAVVAVN